MTLEEEHYQEQRTAVATPSKLSMIGDLNFFELTPGCGTWEKTLKTSLHLFPGFPADVWIYPVQSKAMLTVADRIP